MDLLQIAAVIIFLFSIVLIITGWIDSVIAALSGIVMMIFIGVMSEVQAFQKVDWNVILILLSIWIVSGYFGKSGVPDFLSAVILKKSKGNVAVFVTFIGTLAGFISMLIDNVVVVLMFAPVLFHASRRFKFSPFIPLLFIGLCANFMGSAMLLGDLPPQMLHSVAGIEFSGFIWQQGRPSSFFILLISYIFTVSFFYWKFSKVYKGKVMDISTLEQHPLDHIKDKPFAIVTCSVFCLTIMAMAFRPFFGYYLGFIALWGALALILIFEIYNKAFTLEIPNLEQVFSELDWRAIFFYISLFALVGGLEQAGVIKLISTGITPYIKQSVAGGEYLAFLDYGADRRGGGTRCLYPDHALCHPRPGEGTGDQPLALLLDVALGRNPGEQPDGGRGPGLVCGQELGGKRGTKKNQPEGILEYNGALRNHIFTVLLSAGHVDLGSSFLKN